MTTKDVTNNKINSFQDNLFMQMHTILIIFGKMLLLTLFLLCFFSCSNSPETLQLNKNQENINEAEISKDVAIEIAKRRISSEYNVELYDIIVADRKTYWGIEFVLKKENKHLTGGGAVVEINKKSGKVINWYFAK